MCDLFLITFLFFFRDFLHMFSCYFYLLIFEGYTALLYLYYKMSFFSLCNAPLYSVLSFLLNIATHIFPLFVCIFLVFLYPCLTFNFVFTFIIMCFLQKYNWLFKITSTLSSFACNLVTKIYTLFMPILCVLITYFILFFLHFHFVKCC